MCHLLLRVSEHCLVSIARPSLCSSETKAQTRARTKARTKARTSVYPYYLAWTREGWRNLDP